MCYVTGNLVRNGTPIRTNAEPLRFGWLRSFGHFNGSVRNASAYSRALSREGVFAQYLAGRQVKKGSPRRKQEDEGFEFAERTAVPVVAVRNQGSRARSISDLTASRCEYHPQ